jgi:hypothetical protein
MAAKLRLRFNDLPEAVITAMAKATVPALGGVNAGQLRAEIERLEREQANKRLELAEISGKLRRLRASLQAVDV